MDSQLFHYKHAKTTFITIGMLTILQGASLIFQAVYLAKSITFMFHGTAWTAVLPYLLYFTLFLILRHLLQFFKERIAYRFAEKTALELQAQLIEKIFQIGPHGLSKYGSGNTITLCIEGIVNFRKYLELFIPRFVSMLIIPVTILLYIYYLDWLSGIILTITMPIMIVFLILLGLAAKKKVNDQLGTYNVLAHHFVDSLRGIVTLKYLGKSKAHIGAIASVSKQYRVATIRTLIVAFLSSFNLNFFSSLSIAVLAVELGIRLINGTSILEPALAVLILAPEYFAPVREFGNDFHATMNGKEAGATIHEILKKDSIRTEPKGSNISNWNENSTLSVNNLGMKSEKENRMIIENINFHMKGFQKVGIIGTSGAGKSSLIDVLAGFSIPTEGKITINGTPFNHLSFANWQNQLTYIPQHPYIFSGTIRENISWYYPDATEEEIENAIAITGLTEFIQGLPNGLEEKIGQGARSISGGEEQRIALARAIIKKSPIMFFDEPTAHLDIETEFDIKQMMLPLLEDKLVFFATHRLHWLEQMDIILVMEHGKLVEIGTPKELFQEKGTFDILLERSKQI